MGFGSKGKLNYIKMSLDKNEEEKHRHPAYGQIGLSRIQSRGTQFFGSELEQDSYIQLTVKNSEINRTLAQDRYFAYSAPLIQLRISSNQFSEMLTNLNRGDGVPCTIEILDRTPVLQLEKVESRKEFVHRKFQDRMQSFANTLKEKQTRVKELSAKKVLSKADQFELNQTVTWLTQEVASNIPFFATCFQETMDEVVTEAKMEVENAIQHKINTLGLDALHEQNKLLK